MKRLILFAVCSVIASLHAERVALVIGNNQYRELPERMQLTSPVADATDVAAALKSLGYTLVTGGAVTDGNRETITSATEKFAIAAKGAEAAVFYYSGHGVQVGDDNYLLPTDTPKLTGISMLKNRGVLLRDSVMVALEEAGTQTKIIILDCCRDNPFSAQLETALAQVGKSIKTKSVGEITGYGPGFYLAFATGPGTSADDGNGQRNSPFTAAMLKTLPVSSGKDIDFFFREVKASLGVEQVSWTNHSLRGSFTLSIGGGMEVPAAPAPDPFVAVSKNVPFFNSLGMKFVPAGTSGMLFSVWETRVKDFEAFVEDTHHDAVSDSGFGFLPQTLELTANGYGTVWARKGGSWRNPRFPNKQTGEHPVVCVSYLDADAFCAWLTKKDRTSGKIPATASYRLPSDAEWSRACGRGRYPWGENYPPNSRSGNYLGQEAMVGVYDGFETLLTHRDSAARTAPVGMFSENLYGLCDMGGNVAEWCSTWYEARMNEADVFGEFPATKDDKGGQTYRVLRGGSWNYDAETSMRSSFRYSELPRGRDGNYGFRIVLVLAGG